MQIKGSKYTIFGTHQSSPKELPKPAALPSDDKMSLWVLQDWSSGRA